VVGGSPADVPQRFSSVQERVATFPPLGRGAPGYGGVGQGFHMEHCQFGTQEHDCSVGGSPTGIPQ